MNQENSPDIEERAFEAARERLISWAKNVVLFVLAPVLALGSFGLYFLFDSVVDRAVQEQIAQQSEMVRDQLTDSSKVLLSLASENTLLAERATKDLKDTIAAAEIARQEFNGRKQELEKLIARIGNLVEGENLARTLSILELDYFTIKSFEVVVGLCYPDRFLLETIGTQWNNAIFPDLIYAEPLALDLSLEDDSVEPLEVEFNPQGSSWTTLTHSSKECIEYTNTPFAPYTRYLHGLDMSLIPSFDAIKFNTVVSYDSEFLDRAADALDELDLVYFRLLINGVTIKSGEVHANQLDWVEMGEPDEASTFGLLAEHTLDEPVDVKKAFESRISSHSK